MSFLTNYGPSLVAIIMAVLSAFQPQVQGFVTSHPAVSTALGALYAILLHVMPGSPLGGGTLGITPPKP